MKPSKRQNWRGAAITAAILTHGIVLGLLVLAVPVLPLPTARLAPDISVRLERRLDARPLRAPKPPPHNAKALAARAAPEPLRPHVLPAPPPLPPTTTVPIAAPTPRAPPVAAAGVGPSTGSSGRDWMVRPGGVDLHGFATGGSGGCAPSSKLTTAEQAACERRVADLRAAPTPHLDAIPNDKRAYYDAVIEQREHGRYAAFKELHDLQAKRGLAGVKSHGIDVNVGYHCTFKFGAGSKEANAAAGKKIGFPPCPIHLPGRDPPAP